MGTKEAKRGNQECIETIKKQRERERENETIKGAIDHTLKLHNESPTRSVRGEEGKKEEEEKETKSKSTMRKRECGDGTVNE